MQLLIILALLLYGGKSNAQNILEDVKPVLETIGGDEMKQALKSAEEISSVLSVVRGLTSSGAPFAAPQPSAEGGNFGVGEKEEPAIGFPLSPVSSIADREITYSLSKYISQN
ncbi:MAG: hypothetical protein K2N33_05790 [Clostridia bacterium]|nr:hypothetical protein [Clostridia bacterium]